MMMCQYIDKAYQEPKFVRLEALLWRLQRHRVAPNYLKDYSLFAASISSSSSSCLQVCQTWENHLIKNVTNKEWSLGAKLCVSS